jgi:hypothetical protein
MATVDYACEVGRMFPDDWKALCSRMHTLAEQISAEGTNVQLIGIYLDGLPIARAVNYSIQQRFKKQLPVDTVLISSKLGLVDGPKMEQLCITKRKRIYIDRRTKTGSLGKLLKELDPEAKYAVLEDPDKKADISASKETVPWFSWPGRIWGPKVMAEKTGPFIGMRVAPKLDGNGYFYNQDCGEATDIFYKELYERMDRTQPKRRY